MGMIEGTALSQVQVARDLSREILNSIMSANQEKLIGIERIMENRLIIEAIGDEKGQIASKSMISTLFRLDFNLTRQLQPECSQDKNFQQLERQIKTTVEQQI